MDGSISLDVFVRQLHLDVIERRGRYVFFLGAGCSITSGIPAAGALTKEWVAKLEKEGRSVQECVPEYNAANPAASYGAVMAALLEHPRLRQQEIERICAPAIPGFGYAALATLVAHPDYFASFSSILTTNFDDLIAEAFYRYTAIRPLIIDHESLAGFVKATAKVPVVVKLHGDHRLAPQNTAAEIEKLAPEVNKAVGRLLEERGLIFLGYSGNDNGVAEALAQFVPGQLRRVYWINNTGPGQQLRDMLEKHSARWVNHLDFDQLMLALAHKFELGHPDRSRFSSYAKDYVLSYLATAGASLNESGDAARARSAWQDFKAAVLASDYVSGDGFLLVQRQPDTDDDDVRNAVEALDFRIEDQYLADRFQQTLDRAFVSQRVTNLMRHEEVEDAAKMQAAIMAACQIYEEAIAKRSDDASLIAEYARYLNEHVQDKGAMITQCHRALALDPSCKGANDLLADYSNWTANATDDVVLSMHPLTRRAWRSTLPNGGQIHLLEVVVDTPPSNWHITEPRTSPTWNDVDRRILEKVDEIGKADCRRIHVFANGPYALGVLLGNRIFQQFGRGRELVFYQYNNKANAWEDWGPHRRLQASPRSEPFFVTGSGDAPVEAPKHVAVAFSITRELSKDEIGRALGEQGALGSYARIDARPVDGIGPQALRDAGSVDRCVEEIDTVLFDAAAKYPDAHLHVFYSGPLAALMRAAKKIHLLAVPATLYERVRIDGDEYAFVPALDLVGQSLLVGSKKGGIAMVDSNNTLFSWIHVSDIHFGQGGAAYSANQRLVLEELQRDIAAKIKDLPVDAIFVTGDVAFSGNAVAPDEYARAREWLVATGRAAGLGPGSIFLVPGNHDVNRKSDDDFSVGPLVERLREGKISIDEVLAKATGREILARRQAAYLEAAKEFGPWVGRATVPPEAQRLTWAHEIVARGGLRVRVVGLNTALLAKDVDNGKLRVGDTQFMETLQRVAESGELSLVLSHHPFRGGWLADESVADGWARRRAHVHLSGHVHEADTEHTVRGSGERFVRIAAGAAHGDRAPVGFAAGHRYSLGAVCRAEDGKLVLRIWPRLWSDQRMKFLLDVNGVPENRNYAEHDLSVRLP